MPCVSSGSVARRETTRVRMAEPTGLFLEGQLEHLVDLRGELELDAAAQVRRDLVEVGLVQLRCDHALDASPLSGQRLLLEAADREHLAGERDLSRHGHVGANGTT